MEGYRQARLRIIWPKPLHIPWPRFQVFMGTIGANEGGNSATEFLDGYLTELVLSMENVFVYEMILESFRVPRKVGRDMCGPRARLFLAFSIHLPSFFLRRTSRNHGKQTLKDGKTMRSREELAFGGFWTAFQSLFASFCTYFRWLRLFILSFCQMFFQLWLFMFVARALESIASLPYLMGL